MALQIPSKQNHKSTQSNSRLPYISSPPENSQPIDNKSQPKYFDLRTNNAKVPKYDPTKDKNLKEYFHRIELRKNFEKNKKIENSSVKKLKTQRIKTERTKTQSAYKIYNASSTTQQTSRLNKEISRDQLLSYIASMRKKLQN